MAGDISLSANFQPNVSKPLDDRDRVADITERDALPFKYEGLVTHVLSDGKKYEWDGSVWVEAGSGGGAALSDDTPEDLGTAAAGTSDEASRSDHAHKMPSAADVGADAAGTAAAAVAAHAALPDPHSQYTTAAEAAAAAPIQSVAAGAGVSVSPTTGNAVVTNTDRGSVAVTAHEAADDPHSQYLTEADIPKVAYVQTTTNSAGQWSVSFSGFASVNFVTPVAIRESGNIGDQAIATLHKYTTSSANGRVVQSNFIATLILGGGNGLEFVGSGVVVRVRIEGVSS